MHKTRESLLESFSKRLIWALKKKGFVSFGSKSGVTVRELMGAVGCSKTTARRYVSGERLPPYATALVIADFLDVDFQWLIYGDAFDSSATEKEKAKTAELDYDLIEKVLAACTPLLEGRSASEVTGFLSTFFANAKKETSNKALTLKMLNLAVMSLSLSSPPRDLGLGQKSASLGVGDKEALTKLKRP